MTLATDDERVERCEHDLDDFESAVRREAVATLAGLVEEGRVELPPRRDWINCHCHSFFSYNGYGYSPSHLVWMARRLGLATVGLVDFDVLDGVDEFHAAGRALDVPTLAGLETRAFLPAFADEEMSSPGEPGVTYHMASGLCRAAVGDPYASDFLADLRRRATERNLRVIELVNPFLDPVRIDYREDVLPLTPAGVATERHCCVAYQHKSEEVFRDETARDAFWTERLGRDVAGMDAVALQALIRSKTMKKGGVAYQQPDSDSFPPVSELNRFAVACGAVPTFTWLDGLSSGEARLDELLDHHVELGARAVNVIPDRNWNVADPELKKRKIAELERLVDAANARDLPLQVGTELNAPGLKLVDDFDAPELAGVVEDFRRGARILFGHTVEALAGRGYTGEWADSEFGDRAARNAHYEAVAARHSHLPEDPGSGG